MSVTAEQIESTLRERIAPVLSLDGRSIEVLDFVDGVARVRIGAACASCPASLMTVITGLEAELRKEIPEVDYLEAVP